MFYVYIIYSESADLFYIGHSDNPQARLSAHNNSPKNTFTAKYRPWKMMVTIPVSENRGDAMKVEKYLKKLKSRKVILEIIEHKNDKDWLDQLVKSRFTGVNQRVVPTCRDPA